MPPQQTVLNSFIDATTLVGDGSIDNPLRVGVLASAIAVDPDTIGGDGTAGSPYSVIGFQNPYGASFPDYPYFIDDPARATDRILVFMRNRQLNAAHLESMVMQLNNESTITTAVAAKNARALELSVDVTRSAGANIIVAAALVANAGINGAIAGDEVYCIRSNAGAMRIDDVVYFPLNRAGITGGFTVGSVAGPVAPIGQMQVNCPLTVEPAQSVSIGQAVAPFRVPGAAAINPQIALGAAAAGVMQLVSKNTVAANVDAGIEIQLDTTVNAGMRGGLNIYRGAGGGSGGAVQVSVGIGSGVGVPVGVTANDGYIISTAVGKRLLLSSDGAAFTIGAALTGAGDFTATSLRTGNPTAGTGSTWRSGAGSPNGAVIGNVGDLWSRTDGGVLTTLYVKEVGNGDNLGWGPK